MVRGIVYQFTRFWFLDLPFMSHSPVATEYNIADTAMILLVVGVLSAIIALFRKKERFRFWGILLLIANLFAFYWVASLVVWALAPPPGIDY